MEEHVRSFCSCRGYSILTLGVLFPSSNLSGGEKTLSSLALVFALHVFKPTPLYFMDEIDAALDFRNVSIVANYIKERTRNAQFIIISLRNNMWVQSSHGTRLFADFWALLLLPFRICLLQVRTCQSFSGSIQGAKCNTLDLC